MSDEKIDKVVLSAPPKPPNEMTDAELDAWAEEIVDNLEPNDSTK